MKDNLSKEELIRLLRTVFSPGRDDKNLAILVDVPDEEVGDKPAWRARRVLATDWYRKLLSAKDELGLENIFLFYYRNVHRNNAELPVEAFTLHADATELDAAVLEQNGQRVNLSESLSGVQLVLAPTQFSTTAPLKLLAKKFGFRAATMPGFSVEMIPALKLDWEEIHKRVMIAKKLLDESDLAVIRFLVDGQEEYKLKLDLRFREAHASGGRFPEMGVAGNLPSGESYIVPYEGEKGVKSESQGVLPVQFGDEIVLYEIEENRAVTVLSDGPQSQREKELLATEPAYGNLAELGLGILAPFGIKPIGEILLDEKLGLHIAFGRSDHFGGAIGVKQFRDPANVVHIDRIYIPEVQPRISVVSVVLRNQRGEMQEIMRDGAYLIF